MKILPRRNVPAVSAPAAVLALLLWTSAAAGPAQKPVLEGLDHVVVAVADLEAAAARYRELGFALKPGRPHSNGIRNQHVKFRNGTEIELLTAAEPRDPATARYVRHIAAGDGPAFVAFYAPRTADLESRLRAIPRAARADGTLVSFPETDPLHYIFFGNRNFSPTDRPEHFQHANGAKS